MIALTSAHNDNHRYRLPCADGSRHTALPDLHFGVYRASPEARRQSIPVNFISEDRVVFRPQRRHHYRAINSQRAGD